MSVMDNIHFPQHIDLEEFIKDYEDKSISASKVQNKHKISPRQYRLVVRWMREEHSPNKRKTKCASKYIYEDGHGRFIIRKKVNKYFGYYGAYKTLEEAITARDILIEHDWDKRYLR